MFDHFSGCPRTPIVRLPRLLDVTLRDGGFEVDFHWPADLFCRIVDVLTPLGVNVVELGYLGGVPLEHGVAIPGVGAFITPELVASASHDKMLLAAMIHPTALDLPIDMTEFAAAGLNLVRIVYHPDWRLQIARVSESAHSAGLTVSINIALASRYPVTEILEHATSMCATAAPEVLYIADTCGAMIPDEVANIFRRLGGELEADLGFHAHNFLTLAYANVLAAASAGATYFDSSILGLGRGGGNLETEVAVIQHRLMDASATSSFLGNSFHSLTECRLELGALTSRQARDMVPIVCGALNMTPVEENALVTLAHRRNLDPGEVALCFLSSGAGPEMLRSDDLAQLWLASAGMR